MLLEFDFGLLAFFPFFLAIRAGFVDPMVFLFGLGLQFLGLEHLRLSLRGFELKFLGFNCFWVTLLALGGGVVAGDDGHDCLSISEGGSDSSELAEEKFLFASQDMISA